MTSSRIVSVDYYSDVLCVWAYLAEARLDELRRNFKERIEIDYRFIPVFASTRTKIGERWETRGSFRGYAEHVREIARGFDHVEVDPDVWLRCVPTGSLSAHAFLKAVSLTVAAGAIESGAQDTYDGRSAVGELAWRMRRAFFTKTADISTLRVQTAIAQEMRLPVESIRAHLDDGSALAALAEDHEAAEALQISGSPTFSLNEGRQKLYGNVGYRIVEVNVQELLSDNSDRASWC